MIRAILFDFYGVWTTNNFTKYVTIARQKSPELALEIEETIKKFYFGIADAEYVANNFKFALDDKSIRTEEFMLAELNISPELTNFLQTLHGHFIKLGLVANLGNHEYELLKTYNAEHELFEVITCPIALGMPLLSREAIVAALQALGEPPQSCLVVTSDVQYRQFVEGLGLQSVGYENFAKLKVTIEQLLV